MPLKLHPLLGTAVLLLPVSNVLAADVTLPPISVGAGVRTSFTNLDPDSGDEISDFELNSARIYLSGKVTEQISVMFNTEYQGGDEDVNVIDAVVQFALSDQFNIWAGRFLPPSDRANLYGPYYASHWGTFIDGVQDGYPFETTGRDDGVMYWGQFGMAKVSLGFFDVQGLTKGTNDVLTAGRVQLDFWDPEGGYYLNGTYYGEKDLLAVGVAAQNAFGNNAYSVDFLMEKKLGSGGVVTVEAEYAKYDELGGYDPDYRKSDGYYVLGAYMFPQVVGLGRFQLLAKYGEADFENGFTPLTNPARTDETLELNVNYLIKTFNARVTLFYIDQESDVGPNVGLTAMGVGLQVQL
jgi:hypothetical protein